MEKRKEKKMVSKKLVIGIIVAAILAIAALAGILTKKDSVSSKSDIKVSAVPVKVTSVKKEVPPDGPVVVSAKFKVDFKK